MDISDEREPDFEGRTLVGPRVISAMPIPDSGMVYDSYHDKSGWFGPHNRHHPAGNPPGSSLVSFCS